MELVLVASIMASSSEFYNIKLTESDVPGARFVHADISQHSVCQLKRWLECRGLPVTGKKPTLVDRCNSCIAAGSQGDIIISIDGGKWYEKKVQETLKKLQRASAQTSSPSTAGASRCPPPPPVLPVTGWKQFPSTRIPDDFCYGSIYEHIISSAKLVNVNEAADSDVDADEYSTAKPLKKGRQYFVSGHVTELQDSSSTEHYFVKAMVRASYACTNYCTSVTLQKDGKIADSSCECKASAMGRCSHIAGLLFALEDYTIQFGHEPVSCTSKLCKWNVGRKKQKNPQPAHSLTYTKKAAPDRIIKFNPRPHPSSSSSDTAFEHLFIASLPSTGNKTMFETLMEIEYKDYALTDVRRKELCELAETFLRGMETDSGSDLHQVAGTTGQADSMEWHMARWCRITASNCKQFASTKSERGLYNLLRCKLWGASISTSAMHYGKVNEAKALDTYRDTLPCALSVKESGFWVNPSYPYFGCSPDGLVYDEGGLAGLVEIKCPVVLKDQKPVELNKLSKKQQASFCCKCVNNTLQLKKTHQYFWQVQMQMAICEVNWCDFVVWSPQGISVERVCFDTDFWQDAAAELTRVQVCSGT